MATIVSECILTGTSGWARRGTIIPCHTPCAQAVARVCIDSRAIERGTGRLGSGASSTHVANSTYCTAREGEAV